MMFSVALIGADGSGKTSVARRLNEHLPFRVSYLYMGANLEATNWMLPSTWLMRTWKRWRRGGSEQAGGPPDRKQSQPPRRGVKGLLRSTKSSISMVHRLMDQAFRLSVAKVMRLLGRVVVFDRHHFIDYYAFDVEGEAEPTFSRRVHGYVLKHWFPRPDLVIYLDAPSEVLFARKGEGTIELLELRRQDYLRLKDKLPACYSVDATQALDDVAKEVANRIVDYRNSIRR